MLNAITVLLACRYIRAVYLINAEPDNQIQAKFKTFCVKRWKELIRIPNYTNNSKV